MTSKSSIPAEHCLAELALAAFVGDETVRTSVSLEEALRVFDNPNAPAEYRARVISALNHDASLFRDWLAGRRAAVADRLPEPCGAPKRSSAYSTTKWFSGLLATPWQRAGAVASLMLVGFLAGPPATRQMLQDSDLPIDSQGWRFESSASAKGAAPSTFDAVPTADMTARSETWLRSTQTACLMSAGSASDGSWISRATELSILSAQIRSSKSRAVATAPIKAIEYLHDKVPFIGDETVIRENLCSRESLDVIREALTPPPPSGS